MRHEGGYGILPSSLSSRDVVRFSSEKSVELVADSRIVEQGIESSVFARYVSRCTRHRFLGGAPHGLV